MPFGTAGQTLTPRQRGELIALLAVSIATATALLSIGWFDVSASVGSVIVSDDSCAAPPTRFETIPCQLTGDWRKTADGWALAPGGSGAITARIEFQPPRRLLDVTSGSHPSGHARLRLGLYGAPVLSIRTRALLSFDGVSYAEAVREVPFDGSMIDLASPADDVRALWIRLEMRHAGEGPAGPPAVLSRARFVAAKTPAVVPNVVIAGFLVLIPLLAYRIRMVTGPARAFPFAVALLGALVVLLGAIITTWTQPADPLRWWDLVTDGQDRDAYLAAPYFALVGLLAWLQWNGRVADSRWLGARAFAVLGIVVWAVSRRVVGLMKVLDVRLDPDVMSYMQIAANMRTPYGTDHREPLWVWATRGWLDVAGWGALEMRLLSLLCSLALILAAYKFFSDYTGQWMVGAGVAWLLSVNPYLVQLSVRGLREELCAVAILAVAYLVYVRPSSLSPYAQAAGLALGGAVLQLLRFSSYPILLALLALWSWRQSPGQRRLVLLPLAFIVAVSVPHAVHNARVFGDPFYSVNIHFSWFRNYEFVVRRGLPCEGCPDREKFFTTPYAGPRITPVEYVFGLHSPGEIARDLLEGYRKMYLARTDWFRVQSSTDSLPGYVLFLVGLGALLMGPNREILLLVVILANVLPFIMLQNAHSDIRLAVGTIPFVTFAVVYGGWWLVRQAAALAAAANGRWLANEAIRSA
jgi:hypothetical protein